MPEINELQIFELEPTEIKVKDNLPRLRRELGEIEKMVASIQKFGQLQPIVINRNNELIAGGRRLAACLVGGFKARVCYKDTIEPLAMREMELEENIQRKALTPAEEALAVEEFHNLKVQIYGKPISGVPGGGTGHTIEDTAIALNRSRASVIDDIQIAAALKLFPDLAQLDTKSAIKKAYKGLERVSQQMDALASYEETIKRSKEFVLVNRDAEQYLPGIPDKSIDLFFTDPPYGIDVHDKAITIGGETGGEFTASAITYDDSESYAKALLEILCTESYRVTKDTGHAYFFCGKTHFEWLRGRMEAAGWNVFPWPIIWAKRETGQNNQPDKWPSAAYEAILFARKSESQIILQGKPDWIQCDPVLPSVRTHQAEKPIELCKELISRVCLPGQHMIDPCMGSGALVEAGVTMKLLVLGCEKEIESYASAVTRMTKLVEVK